MKNAYLNLYVIFIGFDEIAGGFTSKVVYRISSRIMFKFNMLQKAPKRRSRNPCNYHLKRALSSNVALFFYKMVLDAIVKNNGIFNVACFEMCCIFWAPAIFYLW